MAKTNRTTTARRNSNTARTNKGVYVEGNTARRLQEIPARRNYPEQVPAQRNRRPAARPVQEVRQQKPALSKQAVKNRQKAMTMSRGFVVFLAAVSVAILFFCINYLQLKSEITGRMKTAATLEAELTQLKEDNDAYYSQVTSNVDLRTIKKIAIGRLGMKYPSDEQVMTYRTEGNSYVRQYQDVPDSK
ncbi:MAG: hypothetical protein Q4D16_21075 [Eubacteriales bacterium]|nr:hypothetical protein [Eubacteriales bacterium]